METYHCDHLIRPQAAAFRLSVAADSIGGAAVGVDASMVQIHGCFVPDTPSLSALLLELKHLK